jgi:hypothetical protein
MDHRTCYVKYDRDTFAVLLRRLLDSEDGYVKSKLIEMLTLYTYESENMCRMIIDLSVGNMLPEPIKPGSPVKINPEKVGWLGNNEKDILAKNTKDDKIHGVVISFNGYHSYQPYKIGFPEGTVDLPMEAVLDISHIL